MDALGPAALLAALIASAATVVLSLRGRAVAAGCVLTLAFAGLSVALVLLTAALVRWTARSPMSPTASAVPPPGPRSAPGSRPTSSVSLAARMPDCREATSPHDRGHDGSEERPPASAAHRSHNFTSSSASDGQSVRRTRPGSGSRRSPTTHPETCCRRPSPDHPRRHRYGSCL